MQPFLNLANTQDRLQQIQKNLTDLFMEVSIEIGKLIVKRKEESSGAAGADLALDFMQVCLDKEFEVANENIAQNLLPQIANYLNGQDGNIDTICAGIEYSDPKPFVLLENRELTNTGVIADLVFKHGLLPMQDDVDFQVENLALSNDVTKECPLPDGWQGQYNPGIMLEREQVSAMTYNLLKSEGLEAGRDYHLYQINLANELEVQRKEEQIKLALLSATQGKPVALQLGNNRHWITLCLLPDKSDTSKINLVMMDGREKDQVGELQVDDLSQEERVALIANMQADQHHLDSQEIVAKLKELGPKLWMDVLDLHDMSVKGQQQDNSCGLDTTLNTAAIIKTHRDYADQLLFNSEMFKAALDPNVYYQKKEDMYYICGQESYLSQADIVKKIGNNLLLRSLGKLNYNENIKKPEETIQDFLRGKELVIEKIFEARLDTHESFEEFNQEHGNNSFVEEGHQAVVSQLENSNQGNGVKIHSQESDQASQHALDNSQINSEISTGEASSGINQSQPVVVNNCQQDEFYKGLNTFLNNDTNKKLLAKYIRENNILIPEVNYQLEGTSDDLNANVNDIISMNTQNKEISLGVINGFIVWLANLVGWEQSNLFEIVNKNTEAKTFASTWAEKIKSERSNQLDSKSLLK